MDIRVGDVVVQLMWPVKIQMAPELQRFQVMWGKQLAQQWGLQTLLHFQTLRSSMGSPLCWAASRCAAIDPISRCASAFEDSHRRPLWHNLCAATLGYYNHDDDHGKDMPIPQA